MFSLSSKAVNMWWSFVWRSMCIGFGIGFVLGALHGAFIGTPQAGFLLIIQLVVVTIGGMYAMKLALKANGLD